MSGSRPPHIPEPNPICNLPKREFIRELTRFAGTPKEILGNEEMMNFFIPLLRADFEMDEKYLRKTRLNWSVLLMHFAERMIRKQRKRICKSGENIHLILL